MKQKLFEDFIDDIDVEKDVRPNSVEITQPSTNLAKLTVELWVLHRARESKELLGQALRTFIRKIEIIAQHSKFIDSISEVKFESLKTINPEKYHIFNADGIEIISYGAALTEQSTEFSELQCYIYFYPRTNFTARQITSFYNDVRHMMRITGAVDLPSNRQYVVEYKGDTKDLFFEFCPHDKDYAKEIFDLAQLFKPGYTYSDYLQDFKTDCFEQMMWNHFYYDQYGDQIDEMWKHVYKVGHFDKTGDSKLLPDYIKDKHPVAGCTDVFLPFGEMDFATSSPWSPTLRWTEMREHCMTHGCNVYLLSDAENNDDAVICVYDGTIELTDKNGNKKIAQIVTETTGHEMGLTSKEMALSCFLSAEEAENLCADFFGSDEDEYNEDDY